MTAEQVGPTYLIDTLYYSLSGTLTVPFLQFLEPDSPYSGVSIVRLTNAEYQPDLTTKLSYLGYRIPTETNTGFEFAQYNETMTVLTSIPSNPLDMFVATTTYEDPGDFYQTTISGATFLVLNGSGKYSYAKTVQVTYDNSVTPGVRTMQVYGYP
ncbi:MAG: hypothetical protein WCQ44_12390 [Opitutaceae bacterium]